MCHWQQDPIIQSYFIEAARNLGRCAAPSSEDMDSCEQDPQFEDSFNFGTTGILQEEAGFIQLQPKTPCVAGILMKN